MEPQITVLDAGGQYCHLIARKVRDLGVYAEVAPSDTPAGELRNRKAIIISGGPSSVYDSGSPTIDPEVLKLGIPVLGICYGHQLMTHLLGGKVRKGDKGEYGFAQMTVGDDSLLLHHLDTQSGQPVQRHQVWMSHRDTVQTVPEGFHITASTPTCTIAGMSDPARQLHGVQFHPEVVHTPSGTRILSNFVFGIAGAAKDWDPAGQLEQVERQIRETVGDRNVFFFVSGGVDSTVAYTLCLKALGPDRVHGTYVDTGLMRAGETDFVRESFRKLGATAFTVEDASAEFLAALEGLTGPEAKRHAIGEEFVRVQERILESEHFLDNHWILGQGTIYPDTIESGGTAKADLIKTHHNRVAGIQKLIEEGRIVEPLSSFYKDEVRAVGRQLGLPDELLDRHPFPGPGLAIRCLCTDAANPVEPVSLSTTTLSGPADLSGWIVPVQSVGVQGDARTYRDVLALDHFPESQEAASELVNQMDRVNRVATCVWSAAPLGELRTAPAAITAERLDRLRAADAIVRKLTHAFGLRSAGLAVSGGHDSAGYGR